MSTTRKLQLKTVALSELAYQFALSGELPQTWWIGFYHKILETQALREETQIHCQWVLGERNLVCIFDPDHMSLAFKHALEQTVSMVNDLFKMTGLDSPNIDGKTHLIEISYGGDAGLDLHEVASRANLSEKEFIALHSAASYTVDFLGFIPGFAYLAGLPEKLHTPRRAEPRDRVPVNCVGMASRYCAIYPSSSPGGWNLIGQCNLQLFDADSEQPALLQPGDHVQFVEV